MRPLSIMFDSMPIDIGSNTIDAEPMTSHWKANRCVKNAGTIVSGL
jgi:hypothetical protein